MKITLELEHHEALLILDPIQLAALEDQKAAAKGDDHACVRASVRQRIAVRIVDQLDPTCGWGDNEECLNPVEANGLCGRHLRHQARVAAILA